MDYIRESNDELDKIKAVREREDVTDYTKMDYRKDVFGNRARLVIHMGKIYWKDILAAAAGFGLLFLGNRSYKKTVSSLTAACAAYKKAAKAIGDDFKKYRSRVREEFGDDIDKKIHAGIKGKEVEVETDELDEDGNPKKAKKNVFCVNRDDVSAFARWFDSNNKNFTGNPSDDLFFLRSVQEECNRTLSGRGYLFLNDVYEALGFNPTAEGQVVGWRYDPDNPMIDSRVDFNIYNDILTCNRDFVNGYSETCLLDFNVDGVIFEMLNDMNWASINK